MAELTTLQQPERPQVGVRASAEADLVRPTAHPSQSVLHAAREHDLPLLQDPDLQTGKTSTFRSRRILARCKSSLQT